MSYIQNVRLKAIQTLWDELKQSTSSSEFRLLEADLEILQQQYGTSILFIVKAFELFQRHPKTRQRLDEIVHDLEQNKSPESGERYDPLPGHQGVVLPGTRMICPEDGCDYEDELLQDGELLYCLYHHKQLIPADEIGD